MLDLTETDLSKAITSQKHVPEIDMCLPQSPYASDSTAHTCSIPKFTFPKVSRKKDGSYVYKSHEDGTITYLGTTTPLSAFESSGCYLVYHTWFDQTLQDRLTEVHVWQGTQTSAELREMADKQAHELSGFGSFYTFVEKEGCESELFKACFEV
ncbi:hypothetical protein HDU98_006653 [Podochytrium sp. JEL0797]|nr:hypothetical protein HDU98_006653 [Podochytrium sp. JEL0797]